MEIHLEENIWAIIDGEATAEERLLHEKMMQHNAEYRQEFICCARLHCNIQSLPLQLPKEKPCDRTEKKEEVLPPLSISDKKFASLPYLLLATLIPIFFIFFILPQIFSASMFDDVILKTQTSMIKTFAVKPNFLFLF